MYFGVFEQINYFSDFRSSVCEGCPFLKRKGGECSVSSGGGGVVLIMLEE